MHFRKILVCGATLLLACALGTAMHVSANDQVSDNVNHEVSLLEQPRSSTNRRSSQSSRQSQPIQRPQYSVAQPVNRIRREQRTNYYTWITQPPHRRQGNPIYANPCHTTRPIGHQRQLANQAVHVIREAIVNNHRWLNFHSKISGWMDANGVDQSARWLRVPLISQRPQLPSGCEITAVTMMLKYRGNRVNKIRLAEQMPRSGNPNYGFVGNPFSASGWWIAPNGLMHLVNRYTHGKAINMTGASVNQIKRQINRGIPVVIWVGNMDNFPNHALTVSGYTKHDLMYNDPWLDRRMKRSIGYLWYHHAIDPLVSYGALSYRN